ncbi:MAG: radical SAM protein [Candidatus Thermoplasmatota archaeon]|nr:radical SAM protein [Candidatus Thermoplasmatota archaeon]
MKKKILLVNANFVHNHSVFTKLLIKTIVNPSLVLPYVAASIPTDRYSIRLVDDAYQDVDFNEECDLVGISTATPSAPRAYYIADEFRRVGKTVVIGGLHPSALPEEAAEHADAVVIGEAELSLPQLLKDFENNSLKKFYNNSKNKIGSKKIPLPRRDLNGMNPLLAGIQTSRGCPYNCEFCMLASINGTAYRPIPTDNVIKDIQRIPRKFLIMIHDSSLTIDPDYTKVLFKQMQSLNKRFMCYGSAPVLAKNEEIIKLSKRAGCVYWSIGFESISQNSLDEVNKGYNVEMYASVIKKIKKYGIGVFGSFVFGFDNDTPDIFDNTIETVQSWGIDAAEFNILTPFPGTKIYHRFEREGRILTKDWSKYDLQHVVFQPKQVSPEELFDGVRNVSKTFYSIPNILGREFSVRIQNIPKFLYTVGLNTGMRIFHRKGFKFYRKQVSYNLADELSIKKREEKDIPTKS